jgi:hypothetical protein
MSDEDERKEKITRLGDAASAAVTAGAAALATGSTPEAAAIQAAAAAAAPLFGKLASRILQWRDTRRQKWLRSVLHSERTDDVASMSEFLDQNAEEEWVKHVVLESVRRVDEATDDAVIPALGRLARQYLDGKQAPDSFFRGLSRVLSDLGEDEFAALQALISFALQSSVERPLTFIVFDQDRVTLIRKRNPPADSGENWEPVGNFVGARHVLHLLIVNGLAVEPNLLGSKSHGGWCEIAETTAQRIDSIIAS